MSQPERCPTCRRPLPADWLRSRACPWCNPDVPPADAATDRALAEAGHPGVRLCEEGDDLVLVTRLSTTFGRIWLALTVIIFGVVLARDPLPLDLVTFVFIVPIVTFCLFFGLLFSVGVYRVRLLPAGIEVRLRVLGFLGWTWRLDTREGVDVRLAYRGGDAESRPELAVVLTSGEREIHFGSFLAADVKAVLAATIRDHYATVT